MMDAFERRRKEAEILIDLAKAVVGARLAGLQQALDISDKEATINGQSGRSADFEEGWSGASEMISTHIRVLIAEIEADG